MINNDMCMQTVQAFYKPLKLLVATEIIETTHFLSQYSHSITRKCFNNFDPVNLTYHIEIT